MRLTFIVTIDPIKQPVLLNALVHSLNLQTEKNFDVVFYNQTRLAGGEILRRLRVAPRFDHSFVSVPREDFLGDYPLWDLYALHAELLEAGRLGDYFMSIHMEEFFDVDYVEQATRVLSATRLDILFGNLCRTALDENAIEELIATRTAGELEDYLRRTKFKSAPHWSFPWREPSHGLGLRNKAKSVAAWWAFGGRTGFAPDRSGRTKRNRYVEDLYFMRREFAERYDWFLSGRRLYLEDVHICQQAGVCDLAAEIAVLTSFPMYLNASRAYHLRHRVFYYQLEDRAFTDRILALRTDDPALCSLQEAIEMYRSGAMTLVEALGHARRNAHLSGTQNLNYRYHIEGIRRASMTRPHGTPHERSDPPATARAAR